MKPKNKKQLARNGRIPLEPKYRVISTPGRTKILLEEGHIFENPFGNRMEILELYTLEHKLNPKVIYRLKKGYEVIEVSETLVDFRKNNTFYALPGKCEMEFNSWYPINAKKYANGVGREKPPI